MHALKVEHATTSNEWLKGMNGVVVEEGADDPDLPPSAPVNAAPGDSEDLDAALDFGALDPDLADLPSPYRINDESPSPNLVPSRLPPRAHSQSPSHPVSVIALPTKQGRHGLPANLPSFRFRRRSVSVSCYCAVLTHKTFRILVLVPRKPYTGTTFFSPASHAFSDNRTA